VGDIPGLSENPNIHPRVYKSPATASVLNHKISVSGLIFYYFVTNFSLFFHAGPDLLSGLFLLISLQKSCMPVSYPVYVLNAPPFFILLGLISGIIF
jgi:hypothetical protein